MVGDGNEHRVGLIEKLGEEKTAKIKVFNDHRELIAAKEKLGLEAVVIAVPLLDRLRIDDVVGAISAHLFAGIWGTLAVAIFGGGSFIAQIIGIAAIGAFVVVTSSIFWLAIKHTVGLRASAEEEEIGLDKAELGMEAYPEFGHGSQTL